MSTMATELKSMKLNLREDASVEVSIKKDSAGGMRNSFFDCTLKEITVLDDGIKIPDGNYFIIAPYTSITCIRVAKKDRY